MRYVNYLITFVFYCNCNPFTWQMKDRIIQFLTAERITPAEFADKIGVQRSSMSHILNGRNFPSASFLQKMLSAYPGLNSRWLMIGDGDMNDLSGQNSAAAQPQTPPGPPIEGEFGVNMPGDLAESGPQINLVNDTVPAENPNVPEPEIRSRVTAVSNEAEVSELLRVGSTSGEKKSAGQAVTEITFPVSEKEIEQVLFFYKDKTFKVYRPS